MSLPGKCKRNVLSLKDVLVTLKAYGKSRKTFRSAPFICAPHPATPHSQALCAMPSGQLVPMTKEIIIDGDNFSTLMGFYDEIETKLTKGLDWKIGRNLDAFNDVLRGGFGVHEYEESIRIKWLNAGKSKEDLGQAETIKYIEEKLKRCHPTNIPSVEKDLELAKEGKGETLFDVIVDIAREHENIELKLE